MSQFTKIQWCDSTCNPTMGCDGCELWNSNTGVKRCYAGVLHQRFGSASKGYASSFEEVTEFPGRMEVAARWPTLAGTSRPEKPWLNRSPRLIFVSDMSDALSTSVSFEFLKREVIDVVNSSNGIGHRWLWLTKRPTRMAEFSRFIESQGERWPGNLWAGTSVTTQNSTHRVEHLLNVGDESTVRFLSVEPQVESIDIQEYLPVLDWVIQGGESGFGARPFDLAWSSAMIEQCRYTGVPYFLKQCGTHAIAGGERMRLVNGHGGDWTEWPVHLRVRQIPGGGSMQVSPPNATHCGMK